MLVLTRKPQEKIRIGDEIVVTVLRTKGNAVRLGIEAPHDVRVLRGEIAFESRESDEQEDGCALHARVPRSQVAAIVPQIASGSGPLASVLHQGTSAPS
ncbi:MAG: carbon storage regulator [Aeoliella sp.]